MCGIVGFIGEENAQEVLIEGLRKLEYRGYDSAGIATVAPEKGITLRKSVGMIANLESVLTANKDGLGIGHTRWATHGPATIENAHPHTASKITIVHNGIIENYKELKTEYGIDDKNLYGNTDTEILVNVLSVEIEKAKDVKEGMINALNKVIGSYAILLIADGDFENLYVAKNKSPLLIGIGEGENYVASDAMAVIQKTKKFYELNDKEIAIVSKHNISIYSLDGEKGPKRDPFIADIDESSISKNGYEHFMLKEIDEQPMVIRKILKNYFDGEQSVEEVKWSNYKEIHIVACGTSYNAGLIGKKLIEKYAGIKTQVHIASEFNVDQPLMDINSIVVFISQSGETADSREVLQTVKKLGYDTMAITNVSGSTLSRESNYTKLLYAGPEISVASTKAYTAQIAVLSIIADRIAKANGKLGFSELKAELSKVASAIEVIVAQKRQLKEVANKYLKDKVNAFFIGRGKDYAVCLEAALKLKEISYILTEGFAGGELKHGTIALIKEGTPVIALISVEKASLLMRSNVEEVNARGAHTAVIATEGLEHSGDAYVLPKTHEALTPLVSVVAMQIISYYAALERGCNIDKPTNLAKSVTVL